MRHAGPLRCRSMPPRHPRRSIRRADQLRRRSMPRAWLGSIAPPLDATAPPAPLDAPHPAAPPLVRRRQT
jgi:hypothetical protein